MDFSRTIRRSTQSLARNASLRYISLAQLLAIAAGYAIFFASIAIVEEETQSSAQMGVMIFAITLPGYLFGMLAGVLVDRYDRRKALVYANLLASFIAVGFVVAILRAKDLLWLLVTIYVCNFILSALLQFKAAARDSLLPNAVSHDQLMGANSILQVTFLSAQALGSVVLAPLLLRLGGASAVGIAALPLFILATLFYARLPADVGSGHQVKSGRRLRDLWGQLREGWHFVTSDASISRAIGFLGLVSALVLVFTSLLPGMAARLWHVPIENMALIAVPGGLGFGLGLWLVGQDGKLFKEEDWIRIGLFTLGGGLALTSFVTELRGLFLLFYALVSAVTGAGFAFVIVSARTYVQRRSPDEMRGRVLSTQLFLSNVASTLPLPIVGGLADAIGFRRVFVVLALIVLIAGVLSLTKPEGKEESWEQSKTL